MNCEYCQSPVHIWFQCPKKPDGWKPARLAKRSGASPSAESAKPKSGTLGKSASRAKSTAVRKADVHDMRASVGSGGVRQNTRSFSGDLQAVEPAVGSALPVDTNSGSAVLEPHSAEDGMPRGGAEPECQRTPSSTGPEHGASTPEVAGSSPAASAKFDKKAWQRNYMKTYLRQYRADVKSGKRTPKPRT